MAHLSGILLLDCPASALNNSGSQFEMSQPERKYDNWSTVKFFRTRQGIFPYVSAQAFRFWLRDTLKGVEGWQPSPIFREDKIAYTDSNPIAFAEDDLFGYMRAPGSTKELDQKWKDAHLTDQEKAGKSFLTLTRVSPFKVSTLVSIAPMRSLGMDFGTMSRGEGEPVPHVHEFYRTTLVGMFSIDLRMLGRFYHIDRTGFRHLDAVRKKLAQDKGLQAYDNDKAYELDLPTRILRLEQLLTGLARISGGAKQALHYTDISPKLLLMGVAKGGNHLFSNSVGAAADGTPAIKPLAIEEVARVYGNDLLSPFYAGLAQGYLDEQRQMLLDAVGKREGSEVEHPVEAIQRLIVDLKTNGQDWLA